MKRLLFVMLLAVVGCGQVDPGERAVFSNWGKLDRKCYTEGVYVYNPISWNMIILDAKVQRFKVQTDAASRDLQALKTTVVLNYSLDPETCHLLIERVGTDYRERIVLPAVEETIKASSAHFPVEKVIQERPKLKDEIFRGLQARLAPYGIKVADIAITNIDFSKDFAHAVEQKQIEEQKVQQEEYKRQTAEKTAQQKIELAKGEAESNRLVRESLSADLLRFEALRKWDGKLPQVTGPGGIPLLEIK